MKSRGVYETPGGTVLHVAHRAMESLTIDREVMHLKDSLVPKIAELMYYGLWYSPEMEMLMAAVEDSQKNVDGIVRLKIYKGNTIVVGRKSDKSLYSEELATFEEDEVYNQADATGFIKLNALRLKMRNILQK
jgi:argininosuccinate synthase